MGSQKLTTPHRIYLALSVVLALLNGTSVVASPVSAKTIRLEAGNGVLSGTVLANTRPGYTGSGYATGFTKDSDQIAWTFSAPAGIYDVFIRYSTPFGVKGYGLVVDGHRYDGMFEITGDTWADKSAGEVELVATQHTVAITKGWGWFDINAVELVPAPKPTVVKNPRLAPCDPMATPQVKALLAYLIRLYGDKTLSGQHELDQWSYIHKVSGRYPAIISGDFIDYSPSRVQFGSAPKDYTEQIIAQHRLGSIVSMMWHWNAPTDLVNKIVKGANGQEDDESWYKGFYTSATTFDVATAVDNPGSPEYNLLLRDIDTIANQLQKFSDLHIPVLWRPLHEADGEWFWWGAKGPKPFKKLWELMYDRLTVYHHLHNLLWVYSGSGSASWYPGDNYVDIVGIDAYPSDMTDPLNATWQELIKTYGGRKLLAITEFGGVPDIDKMRRFGEYWDYFVTWVGEVVPGNVSDVYLKSVYDSQNVLTGGE